MKPCYVRIIFFPAETAEPEIGNKSITFGVSVPPLTGPT